jgi:3-deoxy-7-phosphoheptulonate synthase
MSIERIGTRDAFFEKAREIRDALVEVESSVESFSHKQRLDEVRQRFEVASTENALTSKLVNTRLVGLEMPVIMPESIEAVLPISLSSAHTTINSRQSVSDILKGDSDKLTVIVGPCSIHDPEAALEYAAFVASMRDSFGDDLEIIMRAYMEKPRTEKDWKGLIFDPELDGSNDINLGLVAVRMLSVAITSMGVPIAMERLNSTTPQYLNGLVTLDTIGARNVMDQSKREYGSGTSSPVGFKNSVEGNALSAVQAVSAANQPQSFLATNPAGRLAQVNTTGNDLAHVILRGTNDGPNFSRKEVLETTLMLRDRDLLEAIVIDASHGNCSKVASRQREVVEDVCTQITMGEFAIKGLMLESNLVHGKQKFKPGVTKVEALTYGQSITDECIGIAETRQLIFMIASAVRARRAMRIGEESLLMSAREAR